MGEEVYEEMVFEVQKLCAWACARTYTGLSRGNFGMATVSRSRQHESVEESYVQRDVEGGRTRYMLLLMRDGVLGG